MARALQTIVISKKVARTEDEARAIVERFTNDKGWIAQTENTWRFRQRNPAMFSGDYKTSSGGDGIHLVHAKLYGAH